MLATKNCLIFWPQHERAGVKNEEKCDISLEVIAADWQYGECHRDQAKQWSSDTNWLYDLNLKCLLRQQFITKYLQGLTHGL